MCSFLADEKHLRWCWNWACSQSPRLRWWEPCWPGPSGSGPRCYLPSLCQTETDRTALALQPAKMWLLHKWSLETQRTDTEWNSWTRKTKGRRYRYKRIWFESHHHSYCSSTHQHIINVCEHGGQHVLNPGCRASHLGQIRGQPLGATWKDTCPLQKVHWNKQMGKIYTLLTPREI